MRIVLFFLIISSFIKRGFSIGVNSNTKQHGMQFRAIAVATYNFR